jgi:hypothetical protein
MGRRTAAGPGRPTPAVAAAVGVGSTSCWFTRVLRPSLLLNPWQSYWAHHSQLRAAAPQRRTNICLSCPQSPFERSTPVVRTLQVAATLVELHTQLLQGSTTLLEQIRSRQASGAAASKRQVVSAWALLCGSGLPSCKLCCKPA